MSKLQKARRSPAKFKKFVNMKILNAFKSLGHNIDIQFDVVDGNGGLQVVCPKCRIARPLYKKNETYRWQIFVEHYMEKCTGDHTRTVRKYLIFNFIKTCFSLFFSLHICSRNLKIKKLIDKLFWIVLVFHTF